MKKLIAAITLLICLTITLCFANSCGTSGNNDNGGKDPSTPQTQVQSLGDDDFGITAPENDDRAILHMIKDVAELEDWQVGKTEFNAKYYVDDMMEIFDGLSWSNADIINFSGDFDFRIDLYRTEADLNKFEQFTGQTDTTEVSSTITSSVDTGDSEPSENKKYAVQYLINYDDRVINMRLIDYSAQKFDLYAELDENQMKMVILCLKYYFGPLT